jgi:hypothetical protein
VVTKKGMTISSDSEAEFDYRILKEKYLKKYTK